MMGCTSEAEGRNETIIMHSKAVELAKAVTAEQGGLQPGNLIDNSFTWPIGVSEPLRLLLMTSGISCRG